MFEQGKFFRDADVNLMEVGDKFEKKSLLTDNLQGEADCVRIGAYIFPFRQMDIPEILSGGSTLVFHTDGKNYLLTKEGACLEKYLELYCWSRQRREEKIS